MRPTEQTPCDRVCDCEWGSKTCIQRRGYIWNYVLGKWSRGENGKLHKTANPECNYVASVQISWME